MDGRMQRIAYYINGSFIVISTYMNKQKFLDAYDRVRDCWLLTDVHIMYWFVNLFTHLNILILVWNQNHFCVIEE